MNWWQALLYGVIQGVGEFLPISSSGHLAILPHVMSIEDPGVVFDLVMHLGTAFAIIIYFFKDIKSLIFEGIAILKNRSIENSHFFVNFCIATLMSVIFILLIKDIAFGFGRSALLIAINLSVFGVIMWISDRSKEDESIKLTSKKYWLYSSLIGVAQAFAVFPGVSRSGITLTASRFLKVSRLEASRFSFLLSLPIILASVAYKAPELLNNSSQSFDLLAIIVGVISSFVVGLLTIHFFLGLIKRVGLLPYTIYRVALAAFILVLLHYHQ